MKVVLEHRIKRSARVAQASSMFDVPPAEHSRVEITAEMPLDEHPWQIGLIVGPSGGGKSSIANELWAGRVIDLRRQHEWDPESSVLDGFPKGMGIKQIVGMLTAVGFGSPPSWLRPFHALSTGEQFRVSIARALAEARDDDPVVIDEFTSVVDRQVAQVASHALQKTVRRGSTRFVGVSCHYDIIDWLQPDWVYRVDANDFRWGCLQPRPSLKLEFAPVDRSAWTLFRQHHYLSAQLQGSAKCWGAFIDDECVAFNAYYRFPHPKSKDIMIGHRLVVLPDYQGLAIGGRFDDWLGQWLWERGERYHKVITHPALVSYFSQSPRWRRITRNQYATGPRSRVSRGRSARVLMTHSFEYVAPRGTAAFGALKGAA